VGGPPYFLSRGMKLISQSVSLVLAMLVLSAHTPWGQYQVYRQKHLLIMSTISDEPTYPFSRRLVTAINVALPEARARPARAKHFERLHSLFATKQMQVMLLSRVNAEAALKGSGPFAEYGALSFKVLYQFGQLQLLAQTDFPAEHAWLVTNAILNSEEISEFIDPPETVLSLQNLHHGSLLALQKEPMPIQR